MERANEGTKRGASSLGKILGVVCLLGIGLVVLNASRGPMRAATGAARTVTGATPAPPASLLAAAKPQLVLDEELAVGARGWQSRGFTLSSPAPIQVVAQGVKHADKGFTVYVMASSELEHLKQHVEFQHISAFYGPKVRSLTRTATLGAGAWTVVVMNSENLLNTMVVHLRVVADPGS